MGGGGTPFRWPSYRFAFTSRATACAAALRLCVGIPAVTSTSGSSIVISRGASPRCRHHPRPVCGIAHETSNSKPRTTCLRHNSCIRFCRKASACYCNLWRNRSASSPNASEIEGNSGHSDADFLLLTLPYSYLSASTGSILEALCAGNHALINPTNIKIIVDKITV